MEFDAGKKIDWGKTSRDYATYRVGLPDSFYQKILTFGVGKPKQTLLDLGTGTGNLARRFAQNDCLVSGIDISAEQIATANKLMVSQGLDIDFKVAGAELLPFEDHCFDCVTANQCFMYFETQTAIAEIKRVLKPNGILMISHYNWLPRIDPIVRASENLILQHNPDWSSGDFDGIPPAYTHLDQYGLLKLVTFFYDAKVPFTKAGWRGRIRASRGIGATLNQQQVDAFDQEHKLLLDSLTVDELLILHRIDVGVFTFNGYQSVLEY